MPDSAVWRELQYADTVSPGQSDSVLAGTGAPGGLTISTNAAVDNCTITFKFKPIVNDQNVIGYFVYRHTSEARSAAPRVGFIQQPPGFLLQEPIPYTDAVAAGTYYYWIAAVNKSGKAGPRILASPGGITVTALPTYGTYTPTLTNVANLDASTAYECQYLRVGNTVTVSGKADLDPTTNTTSTQLGISLPVASNFGATEDCAGTGFAPSVQRAGAAVRADTANDRAEMAFICFHTTNEPYYFHFTYQVI